MKLIYRPRKYSWDTGSAVSMHLPSKDGDADGRRIDAGGRRVDAVASNPFVSRRKEAIDFTIGCPTCAKYLTDEATLDPTSVTKLLEKDKHDKHGAAAARIDVDFTAIALTTYAGIGDEILNKHVNPYFNDLREKELKEGGNGWKTSQRRLRFLEKNSIVMCRGNADMIRRATPYQKAVAIRRAG